MSETTGPNSDPELRELDPAEERRLAALLRNASAPSEIDPERHERLLLLSLVDPFARASAEEAIEGARLRRALEGRGAHEQLDLARALSAAFAPNREQPLPEPELGSKIERTRSRRPIFYRFAGLGTALAIAAAILFRITPELHERSAPAPDLATLALAQSRSTAPLFRAHAASAPSERIDRIASARGRDLRANRYALWGVR